MWFCTFELYVKNRVYSVLENTYDWLKINDRFDKKKNKLNATTQFIISPYKIQFIEIIFFVHIKRVVFEHDAQKMNVYCEKK